MINEVIFGPQALMNWHTDGQTDEQNCSRPLDQLAVVTNLLLSRHLSVNACGPDKGCQWSGNGLNKLVQIWQFNENTFNAYAHFCSADVNTSLVVQWATLHAGCREQICICFGRDERADADAELSEGQDERHQGCLELNYTREMKASLTHNQPQRSAKPHHGTTQAKQHHRGLRSQRPKRDPAWQR